MSDLSVIFSVKNLFCRFHFVSRSAIRGLHQQKTVFTLDRTVVQPMFKSNGIPKSVLAFSLFKDQLAYLEMTSDLRVVSWNMKEIFEGSKFRRNDHSHCQDMVWNTIQSLPTADVYLMESTIFQPTTVSTISFTLNRMFLDTVFVLLLNHRSSPDKTLQNRVFKLKHAMVSRYFGVLIGGQRIECSPIARQTIEQSCDITCGVEVPFHIANTFLEKEKRVQEQMTHCLMQAVFFYKNLKQLQKTETTDKSPEKSNDSILSAI